MEQQMFGISSVAERWGVSPDTIRRLIKRGELKAINVAGRRLIPRREVETVELTGVGTGRKRTAKSRAV